MHRALYVSMSYQQLEGREDHHRLRLPNLLENDAYLLVQMTAHRHLIHLVVLALGLQVLGSSEPMLLQSEIGEQERSRVGSIRVEVASQFNYSI